MQNKHEKYPYRLRPIGQVAAPTPSGPFSLEISSAFRDGLKQLVSFSHVLVLWWADQMDTEERRQILTTTLPYAPGVEAGVFSCRSEYRPNPIALTTAPLMGVDEENGIVHLAWIDANDGTPVLDLKPYIPITDRYRDVHVAPWMADWPMWVEEAEAYFEEHATDFGE